MTRRASARAGQRFGEFETARPFSAVHAASGWAKLSHCGLPCGIPPAAGPRTNTCSGRPCCKEHPVGAEEVDVGSTGHRWESRRGQRPASTAQHEPAVDHALAEPRFAGRRPQAKRQNRIESSRGTRAGARAQRRGSSARRDGPPGRGLRACRWPGRGTRGSSRSKRRRTAAPCPRPAPAPSAPAGRWVSLRSACAVTWYTAQPGTASRATKSSPLRRGRPTRARRPARHRAEVPGVYLVDHEHVARDLPEDRVRWAADACAGDVAHLRVGHGAPRQRPHRVQVTRNANSARSATPPFPQWCKKNPHQVEVARARPSAAGRRAGRTHRRPTRAAWFPLRSVRDGLVHQSQPVEPAGAHPIAFGQCPAQPPAQRRAPRPRAGGRPRHRPSRPARDAPLGDVPGLGQPPRQRQEQQALVQQPAQVVWRAAQLRGQPP